MKITEDNIPLIEKALNIKLFDTQKQYLLDKCDYWFRGRGTGKTFAYCIKLALSDGKLLYMERPEIFCDSDYGPNNNEVIYARGYFKRQFLEVWNRLKYCGFPVRGIIT